MRTIANKLLILLIVPFTLWACKEEQEYKDTDLSGVTELIAPAGDETTYLRNSAATLTFEWEVVKAGTVHYEVAFYATSTGEELFRFVPEDGAHDGITYIPHRTIDAIAALAGIETAQEGNLYWNVFTKKGMVEVKSSVASKQLPVKRFTGLAELPVKLYLTGAATEGGSDITKAQEFRNDDPNIFVIYTELKAGEPFYFVNNNAGAGYKKYSYVDGGIVENGEPMTVDADGIYRLTINFNRYRYTVETIDNLHLYYPSGMTVGGSTVKEWPMNYEGGGVWKLEQFKLDFTDSRYHFRLNINGTAMVWGHSEENVSGPPESIDGAYYYIYENVVPGDDWYRTYKLMSELTNITADITVDMSAASAHVTHIIDPGELDLQPVAALTSPADGYAHTVVLSGSSLEFSWQEAPTTTDFPAKYTVVFYKMVNEELVEFSSNTIQADGGGLTNKATITQGRLEELAKNAGIPVGESGSVYWDVRTSMLKNSVMSTAEPRELIITRVQGIPTTLYISGAASEWSNVTGAKKMRKIDDGVFEIYVKMSNNSGGYRLTDGQTTSSTAYSGTSLEPVAYGATIASPNTSSTGYPYRITVDFNNQRITTQIIRTVTFHIPGRSSRNTPMTYQSDGQWSVTNWSVGSGDGRHYMRVSYTTANPSTNGSVWTEKWGCSVRDTYPDPTTTNLPTNYGGENYFNVITYIGSSNFYESNPGEADWDYAWKFVSGRNSSDGNKDINVYMNADTPYYQMTDR